MAAMQSVIGDELLLAIIDDTCHLRRIVATAYYYSLRYITHSLINWIMKRNESIK